jgi:hypothetical protein
LRSKARRRNRTNRAASQKKGPPTKVPDISAMKNRSGRSQTIRPRSRSR